jgi:insulysin
VVGENDANELKNVTKQDILDLFNSRIHPSSPKRAKLAVHLHSQKPRPKKVSSAASQAFEALVQGAGVATVNGEHTLGTDQPSMLDYLKHWHGVLMEGGMAPERVKELLTKVPGLVEQYPAEGDDDDSVVIKGATYIKDVKAFQASLELSEPGRPLVEWGDLPVSKF